MPLTVLPTLYADEIDDLLYLARTNDAHDLKAGIEAIAESQKTSPSTILTATVDPDSGNSLLHMASANGCMDILTYLYPSHPPLPSSDPSSPLNPNLRNSSGNTPLHWAALNGHLDAVKFLVNMGADPAIRNHAGHDAVYEAERSEKDEVAGWLLNEGKGLERGVAGGDRSGDVEKEGEEDVGEVVEEDGEKVEAAENDRLVKEQDSLREVQNGVETFHVDENGG